MPVFLKFDGVDGEVRSRSGSVIVVMGDGSVRPFKNSTNPSFGGGPRVVVFDGATRSGGNRGHKFSLERHFGSGGGAPNAIEVSRIVLPNSPLAFDAIDSRDGDAGGKARQLFNAAANSAGGLIVSITKAAVREAANKFRHSSNLKQLGIAANATIPALGFLVSDLGNSNVVSIEMKEVLVTSWQGGAAGGSIPMENFTLNFTQVKVSSISR